MHEKVHLTDRQVDGYVITLGLVNLVNMVTYSSMVVVVFLMWQR